jgi:hypothetical protein
MALRDTHYESLNLHEDVVYTLDSRFGPSSSSNPLVIAIHPFFVPDSSFVDTYPQRANHFLRTYQGPVLILEEDIQVGNARIPRMDMTLERIHRFGTVPERYFVLTQAYDPTPRDLDWEGLFVLLDDLNVNNLMLMGGLNKKHKSANERGCLGYLRYRLRREGFDVTELPDLIFTPESFQSATRSRFESFVYSPL